MPATKNLFSAVVGVVAVLGLAACTPSVEEPLTTSQIQEVLNAVEKPSALTKFSARSQADFEETYGDQGDMTPTFDNVSDECAAVSDADRVTRFSQGGNSFKKFSPRALRGFNDIGGLHWQIKTPEGSDEYSYANLDVAILTFDTADDAFDYTAVVRDNAESCFDFRVDLGEGESSLNTTLELMSLKIDDDDSGNFRMETIYDIDLSLFGAEVNTSYDQIMAVYHLGPNVVMMHGSVDSEARSLLGVSRDDVLAGIDELIPTLEGLFLDVLEQ
jgi:hypothetical protein